MFGFWRKNDGFKWVEYVPTQILARRKARRDRIKRATDDAKEAARVAAKRSVAGIEQGVVHVGAAAAAGAANAGYGLEHGARRLARLAGAGRRKLAGAGIVRLVGGLGAIVLVAAGVYSAQYGFDRGGRIAIACGVASLAMAALPVFWRRFAPGVARVALDALKTRRATDVAGANGRMSAGPSGLPGGDGCPGPVGPRRGWLECPLDLFGRYGGGRPTRHGDRKGSGVKVIKIGETEIGWPASPRPKPNNRAAKAAGVGAAARRLAAP